MTTESEKGRYPNIEFPRELDICLSNQCNLNCAYCYVAGKKRSRPDWLGIGQVERGLDLYLSRIKASRIQKISFSGGEPFLNFGLLMDGVRMARKKAGERVKIEVFTNGTLLSSDKAQALLDENVDLIISIDGGRQANDSNRRFWAEPGKSVFDVVNSNIEGLRLDQRGRIYAGATFNARTAGRLGGSVRFLLSRGFRCVIVDLDVLAMWKPRDITRFEKGVWEIKRIYAASLENGFGEVRAKVRFDFIIPRTELAEVLSPPGLRELSLAPDGCFYPSGLVSAYGPEKARYRIGTLDSGFDCGKMNRVLSEVRSYFSRNRMKGYNGCPTHVYFGCRLKGIDPAVIFKRQERLFKSLDRIVSPIVDLELLLNRLCSNKEIGDFEHRPRYAAGQEISRLNIRFEGLPAIGHARDSIDMLLYSPGRQKTLLMSDSSLCRGFTAIEALAVYAMMKARHLAKSAKIVVAASSKTVGKLNMDFMREHGIFLQLTA